ncbi:MAG TPA: LuxR C-terminal-related transcriptional regulator [Chloroflexota bacterium]|nr:LuxR C-terminal-related transcriptional regulator [Chloroflexota bacterium]
MNTADLRLRAEVERASRPSSLADLYGLVEVLNKAAATLLQNCDRIAQARPPSSADSPKCMLHVVDPVRLTAREWQVAELVARGFTNAQIARALVITTGTAKLHVKHLLSKLGFGRRTEIAVWMVERSSARGVQ